MHASVMIFTNDCQTKENFSTYVKLLKLNQWLGRVCTVYSSSKVYTGSLSPTQLNTTLSNNRVDTIREELQILERFHRLTVSWILSTNNILNFTKVNSHTVTIGQTLYWRFQSSAVFNEPSWGSKIRYTGRAFLYHTVGWILCYLRYFLR